MGLKKSIDDFCKIRIRSMGEENGKKNENFIY